MWRPAHFRSALKAKGLSRRDFHRLLVAKLGKGDAPYVSTVYTWAEDGSAGPKRESWKRAIRELLGRRRASA